jgi:hypothetical protein
MEGTGNSHTVTHRTAPFTLLGLLVQAFLASLLATTVDEATVVYKYNIIPVLWRKPFPVVVFGVSARFVSLSD